jgi:hypothetical protein
LTLSELNEPFASVGFVRGKSPDII